MPDKQLFLAAGLQSGGTTLVSWCFLQREDMDGVLDLPHDFLRPLQETAAPRVWAKATIACFRYQEFAEFHRWSGYEVKPLLIVRDVRHVYASLRKKWYGMNGTTAEDPPLRIRLMRFLEDWRMFRDRNWPILRYESLVENPENALKGICGDMGIPWDEAMLNWPKQANDIIDTSSGNETFFNSLEHGDIRQAVIQSKAHHTQAAIPAEELAWIEERFAEYNAAHGYPAHVHVAPGSPDYRIPRYEGTRRDLTQEELERTRESQQRLHGHLDRILRHPVLGRAVRYWARIVNPGLSEILNDEDINRAK